MLARLLRFLQAMKHFWAPWRLAYVAAPKDDGCIFCRAIESPADREHLLLLRGTRCIVMLNRFPYNSGHLMVAPHRHTADFATLADDELLEMLRLTARLKRLLERRMRPDGFNIGINCGKAAGAGIEEHIHLHIVPRWNGDTNFMTVMEDIRVVPQALDALYTDLAAGLQEDPS